MDKLINAEQEIPVCEDPDQPQIHRVPNLPVPAITGDNNRGADLLSALPKPHHNRAGDRDRGVHGIGPVKVAARRIVRANSESRFWRSKGNILDMVVFACLIALIIYVSLTTKESEELVLEADDIILLVIVVSR